MKLTNDDRNQPATKGDIVNLIEAIYDNKTEMLLKLTNDDRNQPATKGDIVNLIETIYYSKIEMLRAVIEEIDIEKRFNMPPA